MCRILKIFFQLFIFFVGQLSAQTSNNNCANATPFCTGQTMNFPATTGVPNSQSGPYYGCLGSQPNPAWFFMQIANGGSVSIAMSANQDIDFICWGPFSNLSTACNNLTQSNMQSCSYSSSNTETCTIANAIPGMFYMILITNFANVSQSITFNQNNANQTNAASTNCGFVCAVTASNSGMVCAGGAVTISLTPATSSAVSTYTWNGPGSYSSTSSLNVLSGLLTSGIYTVRGTANATLNGTPYSGTCQAVTSVSVLQYPTFSITPTATNICQGGNVFAAVTFTPASNAAYSYNWQPFGGAGVFNPTQQNTLIAPLLLPTTTTMATLIYSVTVQPASTVVSCAITKTMAISIFNPLTPSLTMPAPLCDINNGVQLIASPGGGTWSANSAVSPGGFLTPGIAAIGINTVAYAVSVGFCPVSNTATLEISKYQTAALSGSINTKCVQDPSFNLMNIVQNTVTGVWSGINVISNQFNPAAMSTGFYNLTYNTFSTPNPTVCPASTVISVYVFNPPTPTIYSIMPRCDNATTVALSATPGGGVWSSNAGVNPVGIQTPSLNLIGTNNVLYTAGLGTCVATTSRTFHVSHFSTAQLTGTVGHLCATNNPVNLMSIVQNTNGLWSGQSINNNLFSPSGLPTGTYNLTYNTFSNPDPFLCPDSRSLAVYLLNPPTPVISMVGPLCNIYAPLQLTVTPATGYWVTAPYLNASGLFTPSLSPVGNNVVQYVIGTNTCNSQQSLFISTEAFVPAIIMQRIPDLCTTAANVNLMALTLNNLGTWTGPGVVGINFNPAFTGAGLFNLSYHTASSPSGLCPDQDTMAVRVYSLAVPVILPVGPFCNISLPAQLIVSPVGGIFGNNLNALNAAGIFNPALASIGSNLVSYSIASGPCIANAQTIVQVEKFISADFAKQPQPAYCKNSLPFNLNSLVQNPGGTWLGNGVVGHMFDPGKANAGNSTVITYNTNSSPTATLCPDTKTISLRVKDLPEAIVQISHTVGCSPFSVTFKSNNTAGKGLWNLGDGSNEQPGLSASHTFTRTGTYQVVYNFEDLEAFGCSTQVVMPQAVKVLASPVAGFEVYPNEITISNPDARIINLSTVMGDNLYQWTIQGMGQVNEINPYITFPQAGIYKITLRATTYEGCFDQVSKWIEVKNDFNVFIPNSFTPNMDGLNDYFLPVFSPYGLDNKTYLMQIFDRWGHQIFESADPAKGWDGTLQDNNNIELKQDCYNYWIRFKDIEGKVYERTGIITVLY